MSMSIAVFHDRLPRSIFGRFEKIAAYRVVDSIMRKEVGVLNFGRFIGRANEYIEGVISHEFIDAGGR